MRYLIAILFIASLSSCCKKFTTTTTIVKDSVIVKEVPRLVEVPVPGDTVKIIDVIECDSLTNKPKPKKIQATTGRAFTSVEVKADGTLTATGGCDSLLQVIEVMDREITRMRSETTETETTQIAYRATTFDIFLRWLFGIVIAAVGIRTLLRFKGWI